MFYSSLFLPKKAREDVFILYAFVRTADDLVDCVPSNEKGFYTFKKNYELAKNGTKSGDIVVDSFADLERRKNFDPKWTEAFLDSMEMDITKTSYANLKETLQYVYGAAEVMGLYMVNVLGIDKRAHYYSRILGRALQCINAIRDIAEDNELGRSYIPLTDLDKHGLKNLKYEYTKKHPDRFSNFIKGQISRYYHWQETAEKGYRYVPKKYLICVKTVSDMYNWTARKILKDPFIVYTQKVKPLILKILGAVVINVINPVPRKTSFLPYILESQKQAQSQDI